MAIRATAAAATMSRATAPRRRPEHLQGQHRHRGDDRPHQPRARRGHAGGPRVEPAQRGGDQGRGRGDHHDDAEEHPAPAGDVGDVRRQGRPEERRQHPGRREAGEDRRLQGGGEDQADQDVQAHGQGAAAQSLEDPAGDQDLHARSEAADHEPGGEEDERQRQRDHGPAAVAPATGRDHPDHTAGEGGGEGERVEPDAVELGGHGRHHRGDGRRLEGHERDRARTCPPSWRRTSATAVATRSPRRWGSWSPDERRTSTAPEVNHDGE